VVDGELQVVEQRVEIVGEGADEAGVNPQLSKIASKRGKRNPIPRQDRGP